MVDPAGPAPRFVPACVHLRTKTQYYREEDQDQPPGMIAESDGLNYWCEKTGDFIGPDRKACRPSLCGRARACFEGPGRLA